VITLPEYGRGTLADVLPSALAALGLPGPDPLGLAASLDGARAVAVLLVDGLGYHQIPLGGPVLRDLTASHGSSITCGFPSTTPTGIVSLGTGVVPGAHGIVGFTLNVPGTDRVLNHIQWHDDPDPRVWQPVPTQFERAGSAGLTSCALVKPEFEGSGLTVSAYRGAEFVGASGVDALAEHLLARVRRGGLVFGYFADLDRAGHEFGVDSPQWRHAAADVDRLLETVVAGLPGGTALIVTADHGQVNVPPEGRLDADADDRLRYGVRVLAGEPRARHVYAQPGAEPDVLAAWREVLGDTALVATRDEAVAAGWFGPVTPAHLPRIGDVVVACLADFAVLATRTEPATVASLVALHGSLTEPEMRIPLLVVRSG
jgi:Type I phosphodiesterase / nucleotide pyrophosphatase